MTPIFSNITKNMKNRVPNGTGIFVIEKQYLQWKPHLNRMIWLKNSTSRHMTIYGQTLGVIKRENNECICKGEKTKLHKIKIVVFWL